MRWNSQSVFVRSLGQTVTACLLGLGAGCAGAAGATSSSTVAGGEAPVPESPTAPAPSEIEAPREQAATAESEAPIAPSSPPPPAGAVAEWLNYAGVRRVSHVHSEVIGRNGVLQEVQALMYASDADVFLCVAVDSAPPSCWRFPAAATYVSSIDVSLLPGVPRVTASYGKGGGFVMATATGGALEATFNPGGEELPRPVTDVAILPEPPGLFAALTGHELLASGTTVAVRQANALRICRRGTTGFTCTAPQPLDELAWDDLAIDQLTEEFPGVVELELSFQEQEGDVFTAGTAVLYLRASDASVRLLAHLPLSYERHARASTRNDDIEVAGMEMFGISLRQAGCVFIPAPTTQRVLLREDGTERTLRPARLQRAPASVPAGGVDPLAVNMEGAWALEPEGGLRRIARCEYTDGAEPEDEEEDYYDYSSAGE